MSEGYWEAQDILNKRAAANRQREEELAEMERQSKKARARYESPPVVNTTPSPRRDYQGPSYHRSSSSSPPRQYRPPKSFAQKRAEAKGIGALIAIIIGVICVIANQQKKEGVSTSGASPSGVVAPKEGGRTAP